MEAFDLFLFVIELISITSFAISGSLTAIKKGMDVFGVVIIGVTTSIGGGVIRDLILGIHPPMSFRDPTSAAVAAVVSLLTFLSEYRYARSLGEGSAVRQLRIPEVVMFWLDTVGLAIFTMVGVATALEQSQEYSAYLLVFVGTVTGVGGGVLRDTMTCSLPYIFVKHFYATACIIGSIVCVLLWEPAGRIIAMLTGTAVTMVLRFLAAHFRWNLPHIPVDGVVPVRTKTSPFRRRRTSRKKTK